MDLNESGGDAPSPPPLSGVRTSPCNSAAEAMARRWHPVAARLGIGADDALRIAQRALRNQAGFASQLLASGLAGEHAIHRAIADELGLAFVATLDPDRLMPGESHRPETLASHSNPPITMSDTGEGNAVYVIARSDIDRKSVV